MNGKKSATALIVRNLDEEIIRELRVRAARHGRSTEAEHRAILREVLLPDRKKPSFKDLLLAIPQLGEDEDDGEDFERSDDRGRAVDL